MPPKPFFVTGGTLPPDAPSYIKRAADTKLLQAAREGEFCYVLTSRQMGKSSLMARTAAVLRGEGVAATIVDLSGVDKTTNAERWCFGILAQIRKGLQLDWTQVQLKEWWSGNDQLPPVQRLFHFVEDEILARSDSLVVIFIDEIDSTLNLPFSDDFFASIRACYNARAHNDLFQRLGVVLLGVASPTDLMKDKTRTPFNIGREITLRDFTRDEAKPLATAFPGDSGRRDWLLDEILKWTGGHPYLTQKLCERILRDQAVLTSERLDALVRENFLKDGAEQSESNLKFVHERLTRGRNARHVLRNYLKIYKGDTVYEDSLPFRVRTDLNLSGAVIADPGGRLSVRNGIYMQVFNAEWVRRHLPLSWIYMSLSEIVTIIKDGLAVIGELKESILQYQKRKILETKLLRGHYSSQIIENATRHYIWPKCSTDIDPAHRDEIRQALVATTADLRERVDHFLREGDAQRHLIILADSGTGKTSFLLNYFAYNERRSKKHRLRIALVYLGAVDCDEEIREIGNPEETILFLDALDEDVKAIRSHRERISELMALCEKFSHVVITCRTQFFPSEDEIPKETGVVHVGPRKAGEGGTLKFWRYYLFPFDDKDVLQYLKARFPFWKRRLRKRAIEVASAIPLLSARPMLLAHIPDIVESDKTIHTVGDLYEIMVEAWLERETQWSDKAELRRFSQLLALNIYENRDRRGGEHVSRRELEELAREWKVALRPWAATGRSLLNRDASDNFKFASRSILEFLVARQLEHESEQLVSHEQSAEFE